MEGSSDLSGTGILKPRFQNDGAHTTSVDVTYHNSEPLRLLAVHKRTNKTAWGFAKHNTLFCIYENQGH